MFIRFLSYKFFIINFSVQHLDVMNQTKSPLNHLLKKPSISQTVDCSNEKFKLSLKVSLQLKIISEVSFIQLETLRNYY